MRTPRKKETQYIVVHCASTKPSMDIGVADIDGWHKERGWDGCGYHVVVRRDGRVEIGEPLTNRGAHARGYNENSVAVCMVGGLSEDNKDEMNFTEAQFASLKTVIAFLKSAYPNAEVVGHRDLSPDVNGDGEVNQHDWVKNCPCFDAREFDATGEVTGVPVVEASKPTVKKKFTAKKKTPKTKD